MGFFFCFVLFIYRKGYLILFASQKASLLRKHCRRASRSPFPKGKAYRVYLSLFTHSHRNKKITPPSPYTIGARWCNTERSEVGRVWGCHSKMQKSCFGSRRRTKVRQRAKTRLKNTHKIEIRKNFHKITAPTVAFRTVRAEFSLIIYSCIFVLRLMRQPPLQRTRFISEIRLRFPPPLPFLSSQASSA